MIIKASMIAQAAADAGMEVPDADFDVNKFPHFHVFCCAQLCRPLVNWGEHWENAKVVAAIDERKIRSICLQDLINEGFIYPS